MLVRDGMVRVSIVTAIETLTKIPAQEELDTMGASEITTHMTYSDENQE